METDDNRTLSWKGRSYCRIEFMTLNIVVLAPIPRGRESNILGTRRRPPGLAVAAVSLAGEAVGVAVCCARPAEGARRYEGRCLLVQSFVTISVFQATDLHLWEHSTMNETEKKTMTPGDLLAVYQALDRVQAIIEFELDGTVVSANDNFLNIFGYQLDEIVGKHHQIFCDPENVGSDEYAEFWKKLGSGEYNSGEFKRLAKGGEEIWLRASYNPVFDEDGKPVRVVKFATDVTASKLQIAHYEGMVSAIERAQAVIEFNLDGTVIRANENFLRIFGYSSAEVVGAHHRIFCDPAYVESQEYAEFWQKLSRGEYYTDEFKRLSKDGSEVWLQASYNPILDIEGRPLKVVKFASDITLEVQKRSFALLEMSTPVTKIWDGVLFAPIVGIIDSRRSVDIMNKALVSITETRATRLLLDISGVAMVDTAVANHLIKIAKAAVMMGCKTIISGISPAIAQTIVELGIDLGSIHTTSTIESALRESITKPGA